MDDSRNWYADCLTLSKSDQTISKELNYIARELRSQS